MKFNSLKEKYNYYRNQTDYKLIPNSYVMIMLDGRSFSKKIKKRFNRPFDDDFIRIMDETAKYLCENVSGCKLAYVQSDEISLVLTDNGEQDPFFGNRLCKIQSIVASMATSKFNRLMVLNDIKDLPCSKDDVVDIIDTLPLYEFDCKAWNLPNVNDVFASILYRQNDCVRNSKEAVAQSFFSHKELHKIDTEKQIEMVKEKFGINWYIYYKRSEKYGRLIFKVPYINVNEKTKEPYVRNKWTVFGAKSLNDTQVSKEVINLIGGEENKLLVQLTDNSKYANEIN